MLVFLLSFVGVILVLFMSVITTETLTAVVKENETGSGSHELLNAGGEGSWSRGISGGRIQRAVSSSGQTDRKRSDLHRLPYQRSGVHGSWGQTVGDSGDTTRPESDLAFVNKAALTDDTNEKTHPFGHTSKKEGRIANTDCDWLIAVDECVSYCVIVSPGHPNSYPRNVVCRYLLTNFDDSRVELRMSGRHFTGKFDIKPSENCSEDYVSVYDGSTTSHTLIGRFCGSRAAHIISSSSSLLLVFSSVPRQDIPLQHLSHPSTTVDSSVRPSLPSPPLASHPSSIVVSSTSPSSGRLSASHHRNAASILNLNSSDHKQSRWRSSHDGSFHYTGFSVQAMERWKNHHDGGIWREGSICDWLFTSINTISGDLHTPDYCLSAPVHCSYEFIGEEVNQRVELYIAGHIRRRYSETEIQQLSNKTKFLDSNGGNTGDEADDDDGDDDDSDDDDGDACGEEQLRVFDSAKEVLRLCLYRPSSASSPSSSSSSSSHTSFSASSSSSSSSSSWDSDDEERLTELVINTTISNVARVVYTKSSPQTSNPDPLWIYYRFWRLPSNQRRHPTSTTHVTTAGCGGGNDDGGKTASRSDAVREVATSKLNGITCNDHIDRPVELFKEDFLRIFTNMATTLPCLNTSICKGLCISSVVYACFLWSCSKYYAPSSR